MIPTRQALQEKRGKLAGSQKYTGTAMKQEQMLGEALEKLNTKEHKLRQNKYMSEENNR